jgi:GGDEF domain-containing protein
MTSPAPLTVPHITAPGWLAVAGRMADLAFETDRDGYFTACAPGNALGRPEGSLLGTRLAALAAAAPSVAASQFATIFETICADSVAWQGVLELIGADCAPAWHLLSLAPRYTNEPEGGGIAGTYGLIFAIAAPPPADTASLLDHETRLWTAAIFAEDLERRFDRLDVEGLPGTLLYLGFRAASPRQIGAAAGAIAAELRDIIRPTDLLGRIDETTIALWCDGMDNLTGAERAARLCRQLPPLLPGRLMVTAGVATRWAGSMDDPATIMQRATVALRLADLAAERAALAGAPATTGNWRVWQPD